MKTTIKDKTKWLEYCGIAGMTAKEWVRQVLGYERTTDTNGSDVMRGLNIGGWSHAYHYKGNCGFNNTKHAFEKLADEVERLADELDKRLNDLTAVENQYRDMINDRDIEESEQMISSANAKVEERR